MPSLRTKPPNPAKRLAALRGHQHRIAAGRPTGPKPKVREYHVKQFVLRYRSGETLRDIEEAMGFAKTTVAFYLKRAGVEMRGPAVMYGKEEVYGEADGC